MNQAEQVSWPLKLQTAYPAARWTEEYFPILGDLIESNAIPPEVMNSAVDSWAMDNLEPYKLPTPWQLVKLAREIMGESEISETVSKSKAVELRRHAKSRIGLMDRYLAGEATLNDLKDFRDRLISGDNISAAAALDRRIKHFQKLNVAQGEMLHSGRIVSVEHAAGVA